MLVNNAGTYPVSALLEVSDAEWEQVVAANLTGTHLCTQRAARAMAALSAQAEGEQGSGTIVNISSIEATSTAFAHSHYSAAKAGVEQYTRSAALELAGHGIRVNAVAPGLIYNDFLRKIYPDEFFEGYAENRSLVGRVGQPRDVANIVSFLVSDKAGYVNGEVYGVSGGVFPHA